MEIRTTLPVVLVALAALALPPVGVDAARVKRQGFAFPGQGGAGFPNFGGFQGAGFPQQNFQNQNGGGFPQNGFPQQGFQGNQAGPQQGFQGNQGGTPQQQGQGNFGNQQQGGQQQGFQGNQQQGVAPQQGQISPNNNIAPTTQRVIDLVQTSPTPAPRTTIRPPQVQRCTEDCIPQTANPYNPVCGSDGTNYHNQERLECYRRCGVDVQLVRQGNCGGMRVVPGQGQPVPNNDPQRGQRGQQFFG